MLNKDVISIINSFFCKKNHRHNLICSTKDNNIPRVLQAIPYSFVYERTKAIKIACKNNYYKIVDIIISSGLYINWDDCIYFICKYYKNIDYILFIINKFTTQKKYYFHIFKGACENENKDLIYKLIDLNIYNYIGIKSICSVGGLDILKILLKLLKTEVDVIDFQIACKNNHNDIIFYILHKVEQFNNDNIQLYYIHGLLGACKNGDIELSKYFISKGNIDSDIFNEYSILENACQSGNLDLVKYILDYFENIDRTTLNGSLYHACQSGNVNLIEFLIKSGANNINLAFLNACRYGFISIVNILIKYGANDWDGGLLNACIGKNYEVIHKLLNNASQYKGPLYNIVKLGSIKLFNKVYMHFNNDNNDLDLLNDCLLIASQTGHFKLVEYLIKLGANCFNKALWESVINCHIEISKLLINTYNASINRDLLYIINNSEERYKELRELIK